MKIKSKKIASILSVILAVIIACSGFTMIAGAAGITFIKKPTNTTLYEGINWMYLSDGTITLLGNYDMTGTVLSYNSKTYNYTVSKLGPNMYISGCESGDWKVGDNTAKIRCDGTPSSAYATLTVTLVKVSSISITKVPNKTLLALGTDWQYGPFKDVEFTKYDISGTEIIATYTNGVKQNVSYDSNKRVSWSVNPEIDLYYPGKNTLYITFCGTKASFPVVFIKAAAGDVNMDGKINSYDTLLVLQHTTGLTTLSADQLLIANVSKDSAVNSTDALMILQYVVGALTSIS